MTRVLFYSSVSDVSAFNTSSFYALDIKALRDLGYSVSVTNKARDFFSFKNYDIAFIYFYRKGIIPAIIARCFHKFICFTGGIDALSISLVTSLQLLLQRLLFILCYIIANKCIIVSKSDLNNISLFWKNDRKLIFSPHGIETELFYTADRKEPLITTICWMGSIANVKRKGVDSLVRGFAAFHDSHPEYLLYIIGQNGQGEDYLRSIVSEAKICDFVRFTGPVSDKEKASILSRSKYYGQLSLYEGFGVAALEAMASECIVLHSGQGGLHETVGAYGVEVNKCSDPQVVKSAFEECEKNPDYYSSLAKAAAIYVRNNYGYQNRVEGIRRALSLDSRKIIPRGK